MIKVFLVDDEEHALNILELFLERIGDIEIVGRSSNGFDALSQLQMVSPDVLFLDIEMPEMNGIELAEIVRNTNPDIQIVFVTAYDHYAISAFEQEAIDYILKPLEQERLHKTIARIQRDMGKNGAVQEQASLQSQVSCDSKLTIRLLGSFFAGIDSGRMMKWRTAKEKELLAFLAIHGDKVHRDRVIDALWPDENGHKAKIYLHTCISLLRKNFKKLGYEGIVKYEDERYSLNQDRVDVDVLSFRMSLNQLKTQSHASITEAEKALNLYQGMLLRDEDYVWAEQEAEVLDKGAAQWRLSVVLAYLELEEYDKAVETAMKATEHSPYDEEAYRLLMRGYQGLGRNDQVLLVYRRLEQRLGELRIQPSAMTSKLYQEICSI